MNWWGKLIGGLAGLATGRPLLALIGVVLGHQFDRGFRSWRSADRAVPVKRPYLRALFETMGHLAKVDGRVTEEEIRAARGIMHELGLSAEDTQSAIAWFNAGKDPAYPLQARLHQLLRSGERSSELDRAFLRLQLRLALADGGIDSRERTLLWSIAGEFGIGRVEFAQMEALARAQKGFSQSQRGRDERQQIDRAYEILGVPPSASDGDVKKAYRRLMNRYHPDKLSGSAASEQDLASAEARTREIRGAYESLKARRGFK